MKRKICISILVLMIAAFSICACGRLTVVEGPQISIQASSIYEREEIQSAIDTAMTYFETHFTGCTLTKISYDEDFSMEQSAEWAAQYGEDEAIVLTSVFYTDSKGGDGSFNPSTYYSGWIWVLTRSDGGEWTLRTCGVG